ncbi:MAG: decaprenyl-phosphate phosphoribosyltransferase [Actinobacteria bacterium]|nr:MAG: decaprenyl-phosphate phosphoribosyltransferase [Actinomycetota bacterium]
MDRVPTTTTTASDPAVKPSPVVALVKAMRPHQWTKNVLVAAVPLAAGQLFGVTVLLQTLGAFAAFCLAASATYLVNDSADVEEDRRHPTKRNRPIAAGHISQTTALIAAAVLFLAAIGLSLVVAWPLAVVVAAYVAVTLTYSLRLKHEPVLELVFLALGFLLRAIAGGAATGIAISSWFLIVAAFGSLFMAAGKRASELDYALEQRGGDTAGTRKVLTGYTPAYLRFVWGLAATVTVTAYCLWAFEVAEVPTAVPWAKISIIPFVLAILRYAVDIDSGRAGAPDEVVLSDRALMLIGVLWVVVFGLAALGV